MIKKILTALLLASLITMPALANEKLTIILDWFPNIDHLPIYVAQENGYFSDSSIDLEIIVPSETSDGLKLTMAGTVDMAVGYEPQTVMAAAEGLSPRVVGRLVGHPLTTLLYIKGKGIEKPSDLNGKKVGYTVPGMMDILMKAFADKNGITEYDAINVGFTIIPALVTGQVDAIMGPFKTYEVVEMEHRGLTPGHFDLEKHGIPDYDELIFITSPSTLKTRKNVIKNFTSAIQKAIDYTKSNPDEALKTYFKALPEADKDLETDAFKATLPYYAKSQISSIKQWQTFCDFALSSGLIEKEVKADILIGKEDR